MEDGAEHVGPQAQAERYGAAAVPQALVARAGKLVAVVPSAVIVAQKAEATDTADGSGQGKRAR